MANTQRTHTSIYVDRPIFFHTHTHSLSLSLLVLHFVRSQRVLVYTCYANRVSESEAQTET